MPVRCRDALANAFESLALHAATTLTAFVAGWAHGLEDRALWFLVTTGTACDLARAWSGASRGKPQGRRLWPRYLKPVRPLQVLLCTLAVLSVLYFAQPDACWPVVNNLIDREHGLPAWRFGRFPDMCDVPHGSVIMLTQAIMPVLAVLTVAILATSAQIDPGLFLRQTWRHIVPKLEFVVANPRKVQLGHVFFCWFMLLLFAAIPFAYEPSRSTRPLSPHAAYAFYAKWVSLAPVALLMLPHSFFAVHAILRTAATPAAPAQALAGRRPPQPQPDPNGSSG